MTPPELLSPAEIEKRSQNLKNWEVVENHHLIGVFTFDDLASSMHFAVKVGNLAEELQHDPEMSVGAGKVELSIFTHDSGGLTDLDFVFAKRVNELVE
jgi:4a-hydroxytetrahydrobiopterin dehydratase